MNTFCIKGIASLRKRYTAIHTDSPKFFLCLLIIHMVGCDLYLPSCGQPMMLDAVYDRLVKQSGMTSFLELGLLQEVSHDLAARERECRVTLQPLDEFAGQFAQLKDTLNTDSGHGLLGLLGSVMATTVLPERLESVDISYRIVRDEKSGDFHVRIEDSELKKIEGIEPAYRVAAIAIHGLSARKGNSGSLESLKDNGI
ncbi:MAG: hypothetical protein RIQ52_325 [Pseudomonadota bacterium]|jgi:hypothetical protein